MEMKFPHILLVQQLLGHGSVLTLPGMKAPETSGFTNIPLREVWTLHFQAVVLSHYLSIVVFVSKTFFLLFFLYLSWMVCQCLGEFIAYDIHFKLFHSDRIMLYSISLSSIRESQKSTWISQCIYCLSNYTWQDTYEEWIQSVLFCYYNEMEVD